ncbi:hypothetical protein EVAR_27217_1 [Eumeta japonica]|uniref:Uncharacterized protein n=1 Tax=Eumeta variegata TaxID=151549 RepID=A0A4C1VY58_EUMVA|nr:hypothetical protein EVAR_27217_1 [Eumeta japonica]
MSVGAAASVAGGQHARARRSAAMMAARLAAATGALPLAPVAPSLPPAAHAPAASAAPSRAPPALRKLISQIPDCNEIYGRSWIYYLYRSADAVVVNGLDKNTIVNFFH